MPTSEGVCPSCRNPIDISKCHENIGSDSTTDIQQGAIPTDRETVYSPLWLPAERLSRAYNLDILWRRCLGGWIDIIVLIGILVAADYLLGNELYQKTIAIWLSIVVVYFPLLEGLTGQSIGKVISRTRVVDAQGDRPGIWKATLRTFTRLIEANPFCAGCMPAVLLVALTKTHQRWGDLLAGTFVLKCKDSVYL